MIQLNLLPDIKLQYQKARRTQAKVVSGAILVSIIAVGAVILAVLWVYGVQNLQKSQLTSSIDKKYNELRSIKDIDKYVTVQNQLANISGLHADKIITSRIFDVLAKLNPKAPNNVRISSLNIDTTTTTITMDGETDTFTGLETFRDTLKNASLSYTVAGSGDGTSAGAVTTEDLFTPDSIAILSQGIGKTGDNRVVVSFKISVAYNPKVFARDSANVAITVPNKETTQSKEDTPNVFSPAEVKTGEGQ